MTETLRGVLTFGVQLTYGRRLAELGVLLPRAFHKAIKYSALWRFKLLAMLRN